MKRLRSKLYTKEKIVLRSHQHVYIEDENGYLFAKAIYPTKIRAEDLPAWYIYGRYYKRFGYLSAKGIVDLKYVPSHCGNHFLKDDFLLISYSTQIVENPEANYILVRYSGYDELIAGNEILHFLKGAKEYSAYDISCIVKQLQDKAAWLSQKFPDEFGDFTFDAKAHFDAEMDDTRKQTVF